MATAKNAQVGPKFTHYRSKHDGQVHTALKHPQGYEDQHPEEYEGVDGGYDPSKGDKVADERRLQAEADSRIDRSGYVAPVMANTPIGTAGEPLPPASLVYANPGSASPGPEANALPGRNDGGQVVVGGADRSQVRVTGEAPALVEGAVDPSDVAKAQIAANAEAKAALGAKSKATTKATTKASTKAK